MPENLDPLEKREIIEFVHHLQARVGIFVSYESVVPLNGWKKLFKDQYLGIAEKLWMERRDQKIAQYQEQAQTIRIIKRLLEIL